MIYGLHGLSLNYCNVITQARLAKETGYDALEIVPDHMLRYLHNGGSVQAYKEILNKYDMQVKCVNALTEVGRYQGTQREEMLAEADNLVRIAESLQCSTIQVLAIHELDHLNEKQRMDIMVENIRAVAEMAMEHGGIRIQIEPIAYTRFNTMAQVLECIDRIGMSNVGVLVDFWHLTAAGIDTPETVAKLNKEQIFGIHFCDGRAARPGEEWNEHVLRDYMAGEGDVDLKAWTEAVKSTGYQGMWSTELISPTNWENDLKENAQKCIDLMKEYVE